MSRLVSVLGVSVSGVSVWESLSGESLSRGFSVQGVSVRETLPPDRDPLYGEEQAVHILLECFLVF